MKLSSAGGVIRSRYVSVFGSETGCARGSFFFSNIVLPTYFEHFFGGRSEGVWEAENVQKNVFTTDANIRSAIALLLVP